MDDSPTASEPAPLRPSERRLQWLLRAIGVLDLLALAAVQMPQFLMSDIYQLLGLGEFPKEPIVGYLARTASMMYGFCGLLLLYLSADVIRYRHVIRFLACCGIYAGILIVGIDLIEGMPLWWTILEGPCCGLLAALVYWLAR